LPSSRTGDAVSSDIPRHAKERDMPLKTSMTAGGGRLIPLRLMLLLACCAALPFQVGCMNVMAIAGKVLFGDPVVLSNFEQRTGVRLADGRAVGVVCTAPASLTAEFDAMHFDVQEEVMRRMRVRGLDVVSSDRLVSAMDATGGRFNEQLIAQSVPGVDYLFHVELAQFTAHEQHSPTLYRGRARGTVAGYEVHRDAETGLTQTIPVYEQNFTVEYPSTHPVSTDQMSRTTFVSRCVDEISDVIGRTFYDVPASELY
jgi:hypothetical protein